MINQWNAAGRISEYVYIDKRSGSLSRSKSGSGSPAELYQVDSTLFGSMTPVCERVQSKRLPFADGESS